MEQVVDVDLFLSAQNHWAADSPHHLMILHEMFLHAASEGQKEAERMMHRGCQQYMPQLDPRVDLSTIQLVHPMIGRRELLDLYLEVYKLHWLPGSPPGELAILQEISSAILDPTSEEEQSASTQGSSSHEDLHPPEDQHPCQERGRALDRSLARVHEAHWQVLSITATLEEEIERLHQIQVRSTPEWRPRSETQRRLDRKRKRQHQDSFADQSTPSRSVEFDMHQGGTGSEDGESDLGDLPELKAEVASFLQGSSEMSGNEDLPLELPMSRPTDWVQWRAEECYLPTWWRELTAVSGEDTKRLAKEVRASFQFPCTDTSSIPRKPPTTPLLLHPVSIDGDLCPRFNLFMPAGI